ncbi:putative DNA modification/repair radical SAM protein [Balneicella halophila]|uniref:Putative DNA modification/repair radical SAM protein n=1 Tax=Balneicella halophila TaxID=1537566 RepID=A0A7L4UQB3_BALHA|nr:putative DNA modification/repair radical SAM protein [Balneicella halophila]PVX51077.1 putative DNA modification/repair radical SAM protein [Balneicella halophila]
MNWDRLQEKLSILSDAAKYDVSCSSSGSKRTNKGGLGNASFSGICHTYTPDGRCVSLLKILLTNHCIYDCLYCVSRKSNAEVKRTAFSVGEVVSLTMNFYRRNYIEGLFLSSGVMKSPDYTMERLTKIAKKLREEERFHGYIHLKTIPGASPELIHEAGLYADRLSVNIELPTQKGLELLAPDKNHKEMVKPMDEIKQGIVQYKDDKKNKLVKSMKFAPAGQSSQMIIGATQESDLDIVKTATALYKKFDLKRVYYSGYVPVLSDEKLPALNTSVPLVRENRLYQTDWLMRFYEFEPYEIVNADFPNLDLEIDPKLAWALRNREHFPVDVNTADYHMILRIPGIGVRGAKKIIVARRYGRLTYEKLRKLGIAMNRAKYFIHCGKYYVSNDYDSLQLRNLILHSGKSKYTKQFDGQLSLF